VRRASVEFGGCVRPVGALRIMRGCLSAVREGETAQENSANDRENRRVRPDRKGERRDNRGGEARPPADVAERESKIAQEARNHGGISRTASVGAAYNISNNDFV